MTFQVIFLFLSLILVLTFGLLIYLAFRQKAINNPQYFLNHILKDPERIRLVFIGDSQTHSTLSSDYISMLREELKGFPIDLINAGKNGDTSSGILQRIDRDVLLCKPNAVVIYIGTNDANRKTALKSRLEVYQKNISQVIQLIKKYKDIPVALISFPPLGENIKSKKNNEVNQFNFVLFELAKNFGIDYIPFNEELVSYLNTQKNIETSEFSLNIGKLLISAFKKYYLRQNFNQISKANGYHILSDGIHLNETSGHILSNKLKEWIHKIS